MCEPRVDESTKSLRSDRTTKTQRVSGKYGHSREAYALNHLVVSRRMLVEEGRQLIGKQRLVIFEFQEARG